MDALIAWLGGQFARHLAMALLHTLWQALVAAALLYAYLRTAPAEATHKRYVASLTALIAIVLSGLLTFSILDYESPVTAETTAVETGNETVANASTPGTDSVAGEHVDRSERREGSGESLAPAPGGDWHLWAIGAWLLGVAVMLLRALGVVLGGGRLRRRCRPVENETVLAMVERLRRQMPIGRPIRVVIGEHLSVPGVVGCLWPTLLLPAAMASGVPADDLQAILAHELAHIRRFDYLVNFCQMIVEALLFFNPAVWWISRQIRLEREACCDAAAVALTGHKTQYAEALVSWAQRMRNQRITSTAALVGLADGNQESTLIDRVRRLLVSGHRPRPRVSWPSALAMVALSLLALAALWQGTDLAVAVAGKILTPRERIEKITEIAHEYGIPDREYGEDDKVLLSGTVRTYDGKPFANHPFLHVQSKRPRYGASVAVGVRTEGQPQGTGTFSKRIEYGRMFVVANAEGYAPAFAGPFDPEPGASLDDINLVLGEGSPAQIRVLDESGHPVAGAEIMGGYPCHEDGSYHHTIKLTTDQQGLVTEEHALAHRVNLLVEADGFEPEQVRGLVFTPDEIATVTLRGVKPADGVVMEQATGRPIAGATIRLLFSESGNHTYCENDMHGAPDAVTNGEGRFALTRLRRERRYLALIQADGYDHAYLHGLEPGDNDIKVALGAPRVIRGKIVGALETLDTDEDGSPCVRYSNRVEMNNYSQSGLRQNCPVRVGDGIGTFEITDFYGQEVDIDAGDTRVSVSTEGEDPDEVVIRLAPQNVLLRTVALHFQTPRDAPAVQGGVRVNHIPKGRRAFSDPDWIEIVDGVARCEVPVPCRFLYSLDYNQGRRPVGYWFKKDPNHAGISIPSGEGPFTIEVPVYPAGAIHGRILKPDGTLAKQARASLIVTQRPDVVGTGLHDLNNALGGSGLDEGRFNATPLPLGGEYAVVAWTGHCFQATEPLRLDQKHQIIERDIQLARGATLRGRLLDVDGTPARNMVQLGVSLKLGQEGNWGTRTTEIRPEVDGAFTFPGVNPDLPGTYAIYARVQPGYRPVRQKVEKVSTAIVIRLEKGRRLTGIVIDDATGWPVPEADVYAFNYSENAQDWTSESLDAEGKTNERGEFVFSNMAGKEYSLGVRQANLIDSRRVTAIGGQADPVTLRITIPDWSELKPQRPPED